MGTNHRPAWPPIHKITQRNDAIRSRPKSGRRSNGRATVSPRACRCCRPHSWRAQHVLHDPVDRTGTLPLHILVRVVPAMHNDCLRYSHLALLSMSLSLSFSLPVIALDSPTAVAVPFAQAPSSVADADGLCHRRAAHAGGTPYHTATFRAAPREGRNSVFVVFVVLNKVRLRRMRRALLSPPSQGTRSFWNKTWPFRVLLQHG